MNTEAAEMEKVVSDFRRLHLDPHANLKQQLHWEYGGVWAGKPLLLKHLRVNGFSPASYSKDDILYILVT